MRNGRLALVVVPFFLGAWNPLRISNRAVSEGNARLAEGKADDALKAYDQALGEIPNDPGVHFNRGAALSALGKHDEAVQSFLRATEAKTPQLRSAAFFNMGNALFRGNKFADAIEAYKRALAIDPGNVDAKWNLELALRKKKDEDEKKKQDDQNKDDKQKQDQQNKDDKQKQDQQKQDQQKQDDKQKQDQQKQDQQKPEPQQDEKPEPPSDDKKGEQQQEQQQPEGREPPPDLRQVEAVLDSLERSPKSLEQERARLRAIRRRPPAKDW